jgi:hypothetical protein
MFPPRVIRSPIQTEVGSLYSGTLINDLMGTVARAEQSAASASTVSEEDKQAKPCAGAQSSQTEKFAEPFGLRPADWNLALLFIIHAQLVRTLEPGNNFANAVDVHQVGSVGAPEQAGIQAAE